MLLAVGTIVELVILARDLGTVNLTFVNVTAPTAAALGSSAGVVPSNIWRTRLSGAGLGAWAAIAFAPFFLFSGAAAMVAWLILAGVLAMIAALHLERRLVTVHVVRALGIGAAVGFAALLAVQIGLIVFSVLFQNWSF